MADFALLNELAEVGKKATTEEKVDLAVKVASLLDSPVSSQENLQMAQAIVRSLAQDAEKSVRQTIASYMRSNKQLPKDVTLQLANDVESIALPILESSTVITEQELIDIIKNTDSAFKQSAIAKRQDVSENISAVLVEHAKQDSVIKTLLENADAKISADSISTIVEKGAANESIMLALADRPMPVEMLQKMVSNVSDRIRDEILTKVRAKYGVSEYQLSSVVDHSEAITVLKILDTRTSAFDARSLVANLIETKRMRPDILMTALLMGKHHFTKYCIAMLSGEPLSQLEKMLAADEMPEKFELVLHKANLISSFSSDIFWALKFIESDTIIGKPSPAVLQALYTHISEFPERFPNAQYFRMIIQSQPGFHFATTR